MFHLKLSINKFVGVPDFFSFSCLEWTTPVTIFQQVIFSRMKLARVMFFFLPFLQLTPRVDLLGSRKQHATLCSSTQTVSTRSSSSFFLRCRSASLKLDSYNVSRFNTRGHIICPEGQFVHTVFILKTHYPSGGT